MKFAYLIVLASLATSCARIESAMIQVGMDKVTNPPPKWLPLRETAPVKFVWFATLGH